METKDLVYEKKTVYDGINLTERGSNIIVCVLSLLLLSALAAAFFSVGK